MSIEPPCSLYVCPWAVVSQQTVKTIPTPGLRERKKERTRERLIENAFRLFTDEGFEAVSVDAIVEAVEVSRRTFFRYFTSKEDVVVGWLEKAERELLEALAARPRTESPLDALRSVLVATASLYSKDRQRMRALVRLFEQAPSVRALYQGREQALEHAITDEVARRMERQAREDLVPRLIAAVAFSAKHAAFEQWIAGGCRGDLAALTEEAFRLLRKTVESAS